MVKKEELENPLGYRAFFAIIDVT
nr:hypothetical protein SHINE37_70302 [Rhizobiaceae bacterium]